ncbi:MAG: hypothetical protein D3924_17650 [Candidatus Electrothrix sp. AR4]|nr:hypothetical protein [Candidatus Electrothrix sp. AR4]
MKDIFRLKKNTATYFSFNILSTKVQFFLKKNIIFCTNRKLKQHHKSNESACAQGLTEIMD